MRRIAYYVSDHGYGHAARAIAAIRAILLNANELELHVKSAAPLAFLRESISDPRVCFNECRNDIGLKLQANSFRVDRGATAHVLRQWVADWPLWVARETNFWAGIKPSLVISDIPPQAFLLAHQLGIPSMAVSNFTWDEMYKDILGPMPELQRLEAAYRLATVALVPQLGGSMSVSCSREIGWLARDVNQHRSVVRRRFGVGDNESLVYVGFGRATAGMEAAFVRGGQFPFRVLLPSHVIGPPDALHIPIDTPESQDYLAACDLVVSKAGYSTIAEAVAGQVPMLLLRRDELSEDRRSLAWVIQNSLGEAVEEAALQDGEWVRQAMNILENRVSYHRAYQLAGLHIDGADAIAKVVFDLLIPGGTPEI